MADTTDIVIAELSERVSMNAAAIQELIRELYGPPGQTGLRAELDARLEDLEVVARETEIIRLEIKQKPQNELAERRT